MDIDEQLINQNTESLEAQKAGEFRKEKRGGELENASSIREAVQQKKNQLAKQKKGDDPTIATGNSISPILKATDESLKGAWENLITSWGLTLIWIDIHAFLNKVFGPSVFRELGDEWVPDSIKKLGGEKTKTEAALLRVVEGAGCGCLNLGCLFFIIALISLIAMITKFVSAGTIEQVKLMVGWAWDALGIK